MSCREGGGRGQEDKRTQLILNRKIEKRKEGRTVEEREKSNT
jgi:hypothetical protein